MPNLQNYEACLIKGILQHGLLNQQQVIAVFSRPDRTLHHNKVSNIANGLLYGSNVDFPPASREKCLRFLSLFCIHPIDTFADSEFRFEYDYRPVGQGLFCSARLERKNGPTFRWVYDCGTENGDKRTPRKRVRREIIALARQQQKPAGGRRSLDLVTLSHFDQDHLSGLTDLLRVFSVRILLLPYLSPWDRLLVALEKDVSGSSEFFRFLLEPTTYLASLPGVEIERILMVPPSGEGPAAPPLFPPEGPIDELGPRSRFDPVYEAKAPQAEDDGDGLGSDKGLAEPTVGLLVRGGGITVGGVWEFVPYNDASLTSHATNTFRTAARELAEDLRQATSDAARAEKLNSLKALYNKTFAASEKLISPRRKNLISLFLYSGPIGQTGPALLHEWQLRHRLPKGWTVQAWRFATDEEFGQLYTGDGYLNTRRQLTELKSFYEPHDRLRRAAVLQVMHHGSKANWQPGLADELCPSSSVFCSDPAHHYGHPHIEVQRDFLDHNPRQVDAAFGYRVEGAFGLA